MRTSPETQQLIKEMCPLDSCRLLFKLMVEQGMVMNVLVAGMEIPDEQLRALRGRYVQDVKKPAAVSRWTTLSAIRGAVCNHPHPYRWFSEILRESVRGSFFTPWSQAGG